MRISIPAFLLINLCLSMFNITAQECVPPTIVANANSNSLFSAEQEMVLGDLTLKSMSGEIRLVRDEDLLKYVEAIGQRLVKHLPPTGLKFTFHIMDIPDANAFNIPGGQVFLSRKLNAYVKSEDELAGVMLGERSRITPRLVAAAVLGA